MPSRLDFSSLARFLGRFLSFLSLACCVAPVTATAGGENTAYQELQVLPAADPPGK